MNYNSKPCSGNLAGWALNLSKFGHDLRELWILFHSLKKAAKKKFVLVDSRVRSIFNECNLLKCGYTELPASYMAIVAE